MKGEISFGDRELSAHSGSVTERPLSQRTSPPWPRWLRIGFWLCIVIAVATVLRRLFALANPSSAGPPDMVALDHVFASHTGLTLMHIVPALAFVVVTPFVFMERFAGATWPERLLFPLGAVVGVTAYAMNAASRGRMVGVLGGVGIRHAVSICSGPCILACAAQ